MSEFDPAVHCHDCGHNPQWWASGDLSYRKRCFRKAGYETTATVDMDRLADAVGRDKALALDGAGA